MNYLTFSIRANDIELVYFDMIENHIFCINDGMFLCCPYSIGPILKPRWAGRLLIRPFCQFEEFRSSMSFDVPQ